MLKIIHIPNLSFPASSADVERSFSTMKRLFTPIRNKLSDENLNVHMRLSFNTIEPNEQSDLNTEYPGDNSDSD